MVLGKKLSAMLSHYKQFRIRMLLQKPAGLFYHILVIGARQPFISSNYQTAIRAFRNVASVRRIKIPALYRFINTENTFDLFLQGSKLRLCLIQFGLCFAHLCRSDQIHGVSNFLCIPDSVHSGLNFPGIRHLSSPSLSGYFRFHRLYKTTCQIQYLLSDIL